MLDIRFIRKNFDVVVQSLKKRNSNLDLTDYQNLDNKRRALLQKVEALKMERNKASEQVARMKQQGEDPGDLFAELSRLSQKIKDLDKEVKQVEEEVQEWILSIPNIPHESVPVGKDEDDNREEKKWGEKPEFDFTPKEHWEIGVNLHALILIVQPG